MATPEIRATFRRPFNEQVAAFRLRLGDLVPTSRWDDIERSAHDRAFMVAGATKADLLADLAGAVDKAIADGTGFEAFKSDFRGIVEKHGWHGWTGDTTEKARNWRIRTIYRTNLRTTHAAGRYAQLMDGNFPFWVYRHGGSVEPRLQHLAWDGLILPRDHPFWATHFPPNEWGCSCRVFGARSEAGAVRRGGKPSLKLDDNWNAPDPRTGLPPGIGKGWDYAPGSTVAQTVLDLRGKLDALPERPSIDLIQDWLGGGLFQRWTENPTGKWPVARLPADEASAIGAKGAVADLSADTARRQLRDQADLTASDYALIQDAVSAPRYRLKDGPRGLIFVREVGPDQLVVVRARQTGQGVEITSLQKMTRDEARRDPELSNLAGV